MKYHITAEVEGKFFVVKINGVVFTQSFDQDALTGKSAARRAVAKHVEMILTDSRGQQWVDDALFAANALGHSGAVVSPVVVVTIDLPTTALTQNRMDAEGKAVDLKLEGDSSE